MAERETSSVIEKPIVSSYDSDSTLVAIVNNSVVRIKINNISCIKKTEAEDILSSVFERR